MAMLMKSPVGRVAGARRVAAARVAGVSRPAFSSAAAASAQRLAVSAPAVVAVRSSRAARSVVVQATKASVGSLTKADLEGKRVFVRAGALDFDSLSDPAGGCRLRCAPGLRCFVDQWLGSSQPFAQLSEIAAQHAQAAPLLDAWRAAGSCAVHDCNAN
jgi:hypothetical protein